MTILISTTQLYTIKCPSTPMPQRKTLQCPSGKIVLRRKRTYAVNGKENIEFVCSGIDRSAQRVDVHRMMSSNVMCGRLLGVQCSLRLYAVELLCGGTVPICFDSFPL